MKVRNENYKNVNMKKLLFFASIMIFGVQRQYAYDISNFSLKLCSQYAYNNRISCNGSELIAISERSTCIMLYYKLKAILLSAQFYFVVLHHSIFLTKDTNKSGQDEYEVK